MTVVVDVFPPHEGDPNEAKREEDKFCYLSFQHEYWSKRKHPIDIGNPKWLLRLVFIPSCGKTFIYPDTMVKIVKNTLTRKFFALDRKERKKLSKKSHVDDKKEARRQGCIYCSDPIYWWSRVTYEIGGYGTEFVVIHVKCQDKKAKIIKNDEMNKDGKR